MPSSTLLTQSRKLSEEGKRPSIQQPGHRPSKSAAGSGENSKLDLAVDVSQLILSTLRDAAQFAPVPYLQEAAGLALGILVVVQGVKSNKSSFRRLASDACGLVYSILCIFEERKKNEEELSPGLMKHLEELLGTLNAVSSFAEKQVARNLFKRSICYMSDAGAIQEYRERLRQGLDVFGLQSSITIRETVTRMAERQEALIKDLQEREDRPSTEGTPTNRSSASTSPPPSLPPLGSHAFSNISTTHGIFTSIAGDQNISTSTNNNNSTNSGNTTTITMTNSNNNASVRNVQGNGRGQRKFGN